MLILIRGAGDLATGVALRLYHCGFRLLMTDLPQPTAVRRTVALSQAMYDGVVQVEDMVGRRCETAEDVALAWERGEVPVVADPQGTAWKEYRPDVLVDAILAKKNLGTAMNQAQHVIAMGPGFTAGVDCHCVVETMRGHTLGRCIYQGSAIPNTGVPGNIGGYTVERVLRAPCAGEFEPVREIGDMVQAGDTVAFVAGQPVFTAISGCLRGLLPQGCEVTAQMKAGDVDPRCEKAHCYTVSDKALAIGGGVLESIVRWRSGQHA